VTRRVPVLIVGGGPVGLALAGDLGWRGISCELIEQGDGSIPTPKMNEINIRSMEFCRRWGIDEQVHNCPFPADWPMDVVFVTAMGGYELARQPRPARRDQRPTPLSPMSRQCCAQTWFDPILQRFARGFPGVTLRYGRQLTGFEIVGDGVIAEIRDTATGETETVHADYLAACDGATSFVRRTLGIGLSGPGVLGHPLHLFFRAPGLLERCGREIGTFFMAIDRDGLWANIRIVDPDNALWRLMVLDAGPGMTEDKVDRAAYLRRALGFDLEVEWLGVSVWTRRGVVADDYQRDGRIFLVGDAAHQLSPTGALGMNTGLGDAVDLGWKLAARIEGWGGDGLLASYDAERRPAGARNVAISTEFYQEHEAFSQSLAAIEEDSAEGAALRARFGEALVRDIARMLVSNGTQLGYRYDPSPICVPDGTEAPPDEADTYHPVARPGSRAPHLWLADGRSTLDLFGKGFVALRVGDKPPAAAPLSEAAARRGVPLEIVDLRGAEAQDAYQAGLVLVRPDGHVAFRGDSVPADAAALIDRVRGA